MNTYKITNITNQLNKRDKMYKSPIDVVYVEKRIKKTINVIVGQSVYLTVPTLPLQLNRLRMKNLITVSESSIAELENATKPKVVKKPVAKKTTSKSTPNIVSTTPKSTSTSKKKSTKTVETEYTK